MRHPTSHRRSQAYFLGKDVASIPQILLAPAVFLLVFYTLLLPRAAFVQYYVVLLGVYFCSSAIGYLVSVLVPGPNAQLLGVVCVFSFTIFAGTQVRAGRACLLDAPMTPVRVRATAFAARVAEQGHRVAAHHAVAQLLPLRARGALHRRGRALGQHRLPDPGPVARRLHEPGTSRGQPRSLRPLTRAHWLQQFGYYLDRYAINILIIFGHGLVFRTLAFATMWLKDRDKKR